MSRHALDSIARGRESITAPRVATNKGVLVVFGQIYAEFLAANAEPMGVVTGMKVLLEYEPPMGVRSSYAQIRITTWLSDDSNAPGAQPEQGSILVDPSIGGRTKPVMRIAKKVAEGIRRGLPKYHLRHGIESDADWEVEDSLDQVSSRQSFYLEFVKKA